MALVDGCGCEDVKFKESFGAKDPYDASRASDSASYTHPLTLGTKKTAEMIVKICTGFGLITDETKMVYFLPGYR
jgi:NADPH-dependent curcumin reductase CurA